MLLDVQDSQLVLVDYQRKLMPAIHDADAIVANALRLARIAKLLEVPLCATEENPPGLGETIPELRALVPTVVRKMAFAGGEDLLPVLRPPVRAPSGNARSLPKHLQKSSAPAARRDSVVLAGCEAHVCLLQTALSLIELEFDVWVATDACGSRTERNRDAAFDRLAAAGAELVTTEMVAFEWLARADHPLFGEVLALVK
jgi:nicotinamidase-related amidase